MRQRPARAGLRARGIDIYFALRDAHGEARAVAGASSAPPVAGARRWRPRRRRRARRRRPRARAPRSFGNPSPSATRSRRAAGAAAGASSPPPPTPPAEREGGSIPPPSIPPPSRETDRPRRSVPMGGTSGISFEGGCPMKRRTITVAVAAAALALAAAAPAGATVQVGSSGWQWGNPLPQGNTIRDVAFAGAQGYAVGEFGTILATRRRRHDVDGALRPARSPTSPRFRRSTRTRCSPAAAASAGARTTAARPSRAWRSRPSSRAASSRSPARGSSTGRPATSSSPTARRCAPTTTATRSPRRSPVPGTGAPAAATSSVNDIRFLDANTGVAATVGRQDLPHHRRRELLDGTSTTRSARCASFRVPSATDGIAVGDQSLYLDHRRRRPDLEAQGARAERSAEPPEHLLRQRRSLCVMTTGDQPDRPHDRRRRHGHARRAVAGPGQRGRLRLGDARRGARRHRRRRPSPTTRGATFTPVGGRLCRHVTAR